MAYTPPGVTVQELTTLSITPQVAVPTVICLVGLAQGTITRSDLITISDTSTEVVLPSVPAGGTMVSGSIIKVEDYLNPERTDVSSGTGYEVTSDYTYSSSAHTITAVAGGAIADTTLPGGGLPRTIKVTYTYTPADYYLPIRFDNMSDIVERFGEPYNDTNTAINSPLSYAANVAFENGAQELTLLPLSYNNSGVRQATNDSQAAASTTWAENLTLIRDINDINVIVPIVGQSQTSVGDSQQLAIFQAVQSHILFMRGEQQYIIPLFGEDSSASTNVATMTTLRTHAVTLAANEDLAESMAMVSPSRYTRGVPNTIGGQITVGGQYVAAALAGMLAARPVSATLTRRAVSGFTTVAESRLKADKNSDAAAGLMVIEQKGGLVQVRHAITLDTTSTVTRELSIIRAKHRVIESVRDTIETQIIGQVVADGSAPLVVRSAVVGVLDTLRSGGDLVDFSNVQARTLTLDPTAIEVRFAYRPAFPVNYVTVIFSLDLTTGDVTPTTSNVDSSGF